MTMTDEVWGALNGVQDTFNRIHTLEYFVEKLEDAVIARDMATIERASSAISSFLPLFSRDWEDSFNNAWKVCGGNLNLCEWVESCE